MPCWFACQCAATVRVTVLTPARASASRTPPFGRRGILCRAGDLRVLRPARPRFRFGLTRAPHESPTSGGYRRIHIRRRGRSPALLVSFSRVPPRCGPDRDRAWHLWSSSARCSGSRPLSRSLRRRSRRLRGDTRRNASSVDTPPRLATCLTAHPTNRVVACRSVRHSLPRPLPHLPIRRVFLRSICARRRSVSSLNLVRVSPGAKRSRRRRAQCGVQIRRAVLVWAPLRGDRFSAANLSRFRPHRNLISSRLDF